MGLPVVRVVDRKPRPPQTARAEIPTPTVLRGGLGEQLGSLESCLASDSPSARGPSPHSASILDPSCAARGQTSHSGVPSSLGVKERTCWLAWGPVGHSRGRSFCQL